MKTDIIHKIIKKKRGEDIIKRENGAGSLYKLGGKRSKPYAVRFTKGFNDEGKQIYQYMGFYRTRFEAQDALNEYNKTPFDLDYMNITFKEVFEKWKVTKYPELSEESRKSYNTSFNKYCKSIYDIKFREIRLTHFQTIIDESNANYCTKIKIKCLLSQLNKFCIKNDICSKDYSVFINLGKFEKSGERKPFTKEEIRLLWDNIDIEWVDLIILFLYTGFRCDELLSVKIKDVHLEEEYPFLQGGNKTESAKRRKVPLHNRIFPIVKKYYELNKDKEYLITNYKGEKYKYENFRRNRWDVVLGKFNINLTPHSARHTFITLLREKKADELIIKRLVGHADVSVTDLYTHVDIKELWETVNLLD